MPLTNEEGRDLVAPWFTKSQDEVYQTFIDHCIQSDREYRFLDLQKNPNARHLFIPGNRPDRVLLVAHVDTVFNEPVQPIFQDGYFISGNRSFKRKRKKGKIRTILRGVGIGADDRAGCAGLWHMLTQNLGHSILLLSGEEIGMIGARQLMKREPRATELQEHQFAIELDRHGQRDMVFYDVWTPEFIEYCLNSSGYRWNQGTCSDISVVCRTMCGVNISIGYQNEHSPYEELSVNWFTNTINTVENWLRRENLPKFIQE